MINQRFCEVQGHETNPIILICTTRGCKKYSRWMCFECNNQNIHDHQQPNDDIKDINHFKSYLIDNTQKLFQEKVDKLDLIYLHYLDKIEDQISYCKKQILSKNNYNTQLYQAFNLIEADIFSIDKEQLNSLIEFQLDMIVDYRMLQNTLRFADVQIQNMISRINSIIEPLFQGKNPIKTKLLNIQTQMKQYNCQKKYQQICKLYVQRDSFAAKISQNEKYLVFCNLNSKIQMNNILKNQKLRIISQSLKIELAEFSQNSLSIILCTSSGKIKVFNCRNNKLLYNKNLNNSQFLNLFLIGDQYILTRQQDRSIIMTNLGNRKQSMKLYFPHNKQIKGFDVEKEQQMMVIGYEDQIDIYSKYGLLYYSLNFTYKCSMDQLSTLKNNLLLITENGQLLVFLLDLEQNQYHKQNQIKLIESRDIKQKYFSLACNNSRIILIDKFQIVILDIDLNNIQEIPHQIDSVHFVNKQFKQIESLNYLIVQGEQILQIIQLQDR